MAFERNLARLGRRNARLADRIAKSDAGAVAVEHGPTGSATIVEAGLRLASAYDPAAEGRRLAETALADAPDLLVAVGLGLGHQIEAFRAARKAPIVVYEPSLPRWRALLEARDELAWLDAADVDCATDLDDLGARFQQRYTAGLTVRTCVQPVVARIDPARVRDALDRVSHAKRALDSMATTRVAMMRTWSELVVDNAPQVLATPSLASLYGAFAGVPAVVVAAGPSLDRQLPALARESDRLLIIAIGQTYSALVRAGIRPDLIHAIESKNVAHQISAWGEAEDKALVVYPGSHPALFDVPVRARFVVNPEPYKMACWIAQARGDATTVPGGATVAHSAVHLAVALGATSVALIGQDLAFTGGRVYASGSAYDMVEFREVGGGRYEFTHLDERNELLGLEAPAAGLRDDLVHVPSWHGGTVATSRHYAVFLEHYRGIGAHLQSRGVTLSNCTEGGAHIPGLVHRSFEDWLGEQGREPVHARERIDRAFETAPRFGPASLAPAIASARAALGRLERAARRGIDRSDRAVRARGGKRAAAGRIDVLRTLARATDAVAGQLAALPWLDDLTQGALHEVAIATHRAGESDDPCVALDEAMAILRAASAAVAGGRALLDRLEQRLAASLAEPA
jgi:hypothetical protein